jgi:hypothetical protein
MFIAALLVIAKKMEITQMPHTGKMSYKNMKKHLCSMFILWNII